MGGSAFSEQNGLRISTAQLTDLKNELSIKLKEELDLELLFPAFIGDKPDHGDLDIVVSVSDEEAVKRKVQEWLDANDYKSFPNGMVISFLHNNFQVDLIFVDEQKAEFAKHYYSYGDMGNLLGYYARHLDLRIGFDGLYKRHNIPHVGIKKEFVTHSWEQALHLLGVDTSIYHEGFSTTAELFAFVKSSTLFSKDVFDISKLNSSQRRRLRKRKMQMAFFEELD